MVFRFYGDDRLMEIIIFVLRDDTIRPVTGPVLTLFHQRNINWTLVIGYIT